MHLTLYQERVGHKGLDIIPGRDVHTRAHVDNAEVLFYRQDGYALPSGASQSSLTPISQRGRLEAQMWGC